MNKKIIVTSYILLILTFLNLHSSNKYDDAIKEEIMNAVRNEKTKEVESLIKKMANPNAVDEDGFTLLHWSILRNNTEISELLIKNGVDLNVGDSCGDTPLHIASWNKYVDIVELLIKAGANANALNNNGANPLNIEIYDDSHNDQNCAKIKDLLLKAGSQFANIKKYGGEKTYYDKRKVAPLPIHVDLIFQAGIGGLAWLVALPYAWEYIFLYFPVN